MFLFIEHGVSHWGYNGDKRLSLDLKKFTFWREIGTSKLSVKTQRAKCYAKGENEVIRGN